MSVMAMPGRRGERGFTLTELLVVLAVIAILAMMAMPAARSMTAGYSLAGDQARLISAFSQARALAIRHNLVYSVAFNTIDPEHNWFVILQHPTGAASNDWRADTGQPFRDTVASSSVSITDGLWTVRDLAATANDFLADQIGPRRQLHPGVQIGAFRANPDRGTPPTDPNPQGIPNTAWLATTPVGISAFSTNANFTNFMREGVATGMILFSPRGEAVRTFFLQEVAVNGINSAYLDLTIRSRTQDEAVDDDCSGGRLQAGANPFLITSGGPTIVLGLSSVEADQKTYSGGDFFTTSGPYIGIGINKTLGTVAAKKVWTMAD